MDDFKLMYYVKVYVYWSPFAHVTNNKKQKSNKSNSIAWVECYFVQTFVAFMDPYSQFYVRQFIVIANRSELSALNVCFIVEHFPTFICNSLSNKKRRRDFNSVRCFYGAAHAILVCTKSIKTSETEINSIKRRCLKCDAKNRRNSTKRIKWKQKWKIVQFILNDTRIWAETATNAISNLRKSVEEETTQNKRETHETALKNSKLMNKR